MNPRILSLFLCTAFAGVLPFMFSSCSSLDFNASASSGPRYSGGGGRVNHMLLKQSTKSNTRVVIDIADQKAFLLVDGKVAIKSPVSTARPGKYTPRGTFSVSQKVRSGKISTIYDCEMPYWMRLGGTPFGMHAGILPGYPASAGCVRMPASMARLFYDHVGYGTRVSIYSSWNGG